MIIRLLSCRLCGLLMTTTSEDIVQSFCDLFSLQDMGC